MAKLVRRRLEETKGFREYKVGKRPGIRLDLNENYFVPRQVVKAIVMRGVERADLRKYPDEEMEELLLELSSLLRVNPDNLVLGVGGDELIGRLMTALLRDDSEILSVYPSFSMYKWHAERLGRSFAEIPLRSDFSLDSEAIIKKITDKTSLIFLCSPNNPTGNVFDKSDVLTVADRLDGVLVVDEAYYEFSGRTLVDEAVRDGSNILVLRTMSKIGFAGLRLGYAVGDEEAMALIRRFTLPFPVPTLSLTVGLEVVRAYDELMRYVNDLRNERKHLMTKLAKLGFLKVYPSETNFILVRVEGMAADDVWRALSSRDIAVKCYKEKPPLSNHLRITVGTREMNEALLTALEDIGRSPSLKGS